MPKSDDISTQGNSIGVFEPNVERISLAIWDFQHFLSHSLRTMANVTVNLREFFEVMAVKAIVLL